MTSATPAEINASNKRMSAVNLTNGQISALQGSVLSNQRSVTRAANESSDLLKKKNVFGYTPS